MIMMTDPKRFNGVILTDNTFGDMLSDQAGGVIGTLGTLAGGVVDRGVVAESLDQAARLEYRRRRWRSGRGRRRGR